MADGFHHMRCFFSCCRLAVMQTQHDQGIGKTGDPDAQAAATPGLAGLLVQGKLRTVNYIVQQANCNSNRIANRFDIDVGRSGERIEHKLCKVHGTQIAGPVGG